MSRSGPPLLPETRALLAHEREIVPQPAPIRERAMARARWSMSSGAMTPPVTLRTLPRVRWAIAAGLLCVTSAAMGAGAYELRAHWAPARIVPVAAPVPVKPAVPVLPRAASRVDRSTVEPASPLAAASSGPVRGPLVAQQPTRGTVASDELRLLRQARSAVASEEFADALAPLGEHARRFKDGRLAEEREALRVKALAGLGRTEAARRAALSFEARFPRSILLPVVKRMSTADL